MPLTDLKRLAAVLRKATPENPDYDMASYVEKYGVPDQSRGQHVTDEFKLPNHITFSKGSIYSQPGMEGGTWQRGGSEALWQFTPSEFNLQMHSPDEMADYFRTREQKGALVVLPDGRVVKGSQ